MVFKRIDFPAINRGWFAARDRPRDQRLRTELVREEIVVRLRTQFGLPVHVRKHFDGWLAREAATVIVTQPGDAHDQHAQEDKGQQEIAHYSSTISMCLLPASSSSLRVSVSEYFGSAVSITMKNLSCVTPLVNRRVFRNGWLNPGRP